MKKVFWLGAVLCWGSMVPLLLGQDVLVLDFPAERREDSPPVGLSGWPVESLEGLASIKIPLLSLNDDGCVVVTVMFEDTEDRILLAKWKDAEGQATVLAPNLSDGVGGWNQQTFKIPYENLQGDGELLLETDAEVQPIRRIVLAWTWPAGVYMSPNGRNVEVVRDSEIVYTDRDLSTTEAGPEPDNWAAGIWRVSLQERIEPLGENIEFLVPFETTPRAVVFRAKLFSFPMDEAPELWVNGRKVPLVSMEIPALGRPGYFQGEQGRMLFAGWRKIEAVLPAAAFYAGENSIILSGRKNAYIKDAILELSFGEEGSPLVFPETAAPQSVKAEPAPMEPTVIVTPPSI